MNNKLCSLVYYFIKKNPNLNKTELVKLSYLTDYNFYKYFKKNVTGIIYKYHHHGPFSKAVYDCIDELEEEKILKQNKNISINKQRKYYSFTIATGYNIKKYLNKQELEMLDFIIVEYGDLGFEKLTEISYETEPMKNAKQGEELNFDYISKSIKEKISKVKKENDSLNNYLGKSPKFEDNNDFLEYQYKVMSD